MDDSSSESDSDVGECDIFGNVHAGNGFYINKTIYDKLHDYQRKAMVWFWGLHQNGKGGILGDDMGLGKTVQMIAFLRGLTETKPMMQLKVLIVLPVTLLQNWEREFKEWAPSIAVHKLHGVSRNEREGLLNRVQQSGGVLLTSYGVVRMDWNELNAFVWDYMICDEGHKIKNPAAQMTKAAHAIRARHKFILTGTPIQNNLMEFWALFSFVDGTILGQRQTFKREYETPINHARKKEASEEAKAKGNALSESLRKLTDPYVLHRKKADVLKKMGEKDENEPSCSYDWKIKSLLLGNEITPLAHKNDLVIWLPPSDVQIDFYNRYVNLDFFKEVIRENDKRHVFVELLILKSLCDHPRLLSKRACRLLGLPGCGKEDDPNELECAAIDITGVSEDVLQEESGKLKFLFKLLENLREEGHRCLVFSRSLKMLNMIEKILRTRQFRWKRLDGSITSMDEREAIIKDFQDDDSYHVFLLTTQVGGTGLNLTGADRVVIVDPSWNPSTDNQAVDRAYRIGQTRSVIVYRLITCGTIEEKIYRRQVFKQSIIKQTMGNTEEDTYRYFTSQELRDLFVLEDTEISVTQQQLEGLHAGQRKSNRELDAHIAFLKLIVSGISDHDLLFSLDSKTMRARMGDYDAEVRIAEGQLAEDNNRGLFGPAMDAGQTDNRGNGGSTNEDKKWQLSLLPDEDKKAIQKVPMVARQIAANTTFDNAVSPNQVVVEKEDPRLGCSIKKEQKPLLPIKMEQNPLLPIKMEQKPLLPIKMEQRPLLPIKMEQKPLLPIKKEQKPLLPIKEEQKPLLPIKEEQKAPLPMLFDRHPMAKQRLRGATCTRDPHTADDVWIIDDSSSSEEDVPKTSGIKKEESLKYHTQVRPDTMSDKSRTLNEVGVNGKGGKLEMVEWKAPHKEHQSFHIKELTVQNAMNGFQSDSVGNEVMNTDSQGSTLEFVEWRPTKKEHVIKHDDCSLQDVKKERNLKKDHQVKSEPTTDTSKTFKDIDEDSSNDSLEMIEWRSPQKEHGDEAKQDMKEEGILKEDDQLKSTSTNDASRTFTEINGDSMDDNLQTPERRSQKDHVGLQDDDTKNIKIEENLKRKHPCDSVSNEPKTFEKRDAGSGDEILESEELRSSQKEPGSLRGAVPLDTVKKEGTLTNTHQLKSDSTNNESRALKQINNVPGISGKPGQGDMDRMDDSLEKAELRSSQKDNDSLHDDDNVENVTMEGTKTLEQEEEDGSPPAKRAAYQGYEFKWLDLI